MPFEDYLVEDPQQPQELGCSPYLGPFIKMSKQGDEVQKDQVICSRSQCR